MNQKNNRKIKRFSMLVVLLFAVLLLGTVISVSADDTGSSSRWLMIGDSYSLKRSASGVTKPWTTLVDQSAELSDTYYSCMSGSGFMVYGSASICKVGTNDSYKTSVSVEQNFGGLLQLAGKKLSKAERQKFSYILVCGGIGNDYRSGANMTSIGTAMKAFDSSAKKLFPNAKIIYGAVNWGISSTRRSYCKERASAYYAKAKELGWITLDGTVNALSGKENYFYFGTDTIHPTQMGEYLITDAILSALKKANVVSSYTRPYASEIRKPSTYKITYDLGGGSLSGSNPTGYTEGFTGSFTLINPTRAGYTFDGWTGTGLSSPTKTVTVSGIQLPTGDRTYTANWTKTMTVAYRTQVQKKGWLPLAQNGETSGTIGQSLRVESLWIRLYNAPYSGSIQSRAHIQKLGWESSWSDSSLGKNAGTVGLSLRMEAIKLRLTGEMAQHYDIYYRVHCQKFGWLSWAKNGESAGTSGYSYRIEAIQVKLVAKGGSAPGSTSRPYVVK